MMPSREWWPRRKPAAETPSSVSALNPGIWVVLRSAARTEPRPSSRKLSLPWGRRHNSRLRRLVSEVFKDLLVTQKPIDELRSCPVQRVSGLAGQRVSRSAGSRVGVRVKLENWLDCTCIFEGHLHEVGIVRTDNDDKFESRQRYLSICRLLALSISAMYLICLAFAF